MAEQARQIVMHATAEGEPQTLQAQTLQVVRRNGQVVAFNAEKISRAMMKAFMALEGSGAQDSPRIQETVATLTAQVVAALERRLPTGGLVHIEDIQDHVELALMRAGEHKVARAYVLYREERARLRAATAAGPMAHMVRRDGSRVPVDQALLLDLLAEPCAGLADVHAAEVAQAARAAAFDGIDEHELDGVLGLAARPFIEREPNYSLVAARLLLRQLAREVTAKLHVEWDGTLLGMGACYGMALRQAVAHGIATGQLDPRLAEFDLDHLEAELKASADLAFGYLGLKTLYDRYLLHDQGTRYELPQVFLMRVAMGLALNELDRETQAIAFYRLLSSFDFMSSTPTLFNAGTVRPQLSSCYLTTVPDDLAGIYGAIRDNALLSKYAGGLGNDWTRVRAMGAHIRGTNGQSQGTVPFLKVVNDTAVAVNQGGKRKGAVCAYLETWHKDIEEFLELRKSTGDERRRTHDMNTAHWIPDLFMERVAEKGTWTLFSPDEVPELHELYGAAFRKAYLEAEAAAAQGLLRNTKQVEAVALWRRMLAMLFETGHPWLTFKDPCNLRSPQRHAGVVHSSNLCTEITLNTSDQEIAVCNLGSVNLANHIHDGRLDEDHLRRTVHVAMRMLDNVIDINYYSVPQARRANLRHRPVGLGIMGFQDALYAMGMPYGSEEAVAFADASMEILSHAAIEASCDLAAERGAYPSFKGSLWSQGILPIDSIKLLEAERREGDLAMDRTSRLDWASLRQRVRSGMRNANTMAIAPTATIANITGVSPSIEPTFRNLYVKSNLSGEFTVINPHLVADLKALGLWDETMARDLKYFDGSVLPIERIPEHLKSKYATAFEMDQNWLIEAASRRQKWLDQAQSLNLYVADPSGPKLERLYMLAWRRGLKTTYYLRTTAASSVEKSTLNAPAPACRRPDGEGAQGAESCEACQ